MGNKDKNILDYWRILVKRKWVIFTSLAVIGVTVVLGSLLRDPIYVATIRIQIEQNAPNILPFQDMISSVSDSRRDYYETQFTLIQSRQVARDVLISLRLGDHPEFRVEIPRRLTTGLSPDDYSEAKRIDRFLKNLTVSPVRNSRLVDIRYRSRDPMLAFRAANRLAETYIAFNSDARYNTSERATASLTHQIANLQEKIDVTEKEVQAYAREHDIIPLTEKEDITFKRLNDLNDVLTMARADRIEKQATYVALRDGDSHSIPEILRNLLIQKLGGKLAELDRIYANLSEKFKPEWPEMAQIRREREETRRRLEIEREAIFYQILESAERAYEASRNEEQYLEKEVEELKKEYQDLSLKEIHYNNLKSEIANRRTTLEALVRRQSETSYSRELSDLAAGNIRIVDPAEIPYQPSSPNHPLNLAFGLLAGLGLGIGLAFFFEHIDKSVKSPGEIQETANLPCIGVIPAFRSDAGRIRLVKSEGHSETKATPVELISHRNLKSRISEAFRDLRTSLLVSRPGGSPRTILVTSSQPGEGKTMIALNLAITFAQMGKRVLLVDADLRKPRLQTILKLSAERGLTNLLGGSDLVPLPIVDTEIPGLQLLPSGPLPPNPADLLDSERFLEVRREIENSRFDHVIFDSPPVLTVADPAILAGRVDAVLLVVWAGVTGRDALAHAVSRLKQVKGNLVGGVLNQLDLRQPMYYGYNYRPYLREPEDWKKEGARAAAFQQAVRPRQAPVS